MHVENVDGGDWCSLGATIALIGAGRLSHPLSGIKRSVRVTTGVEFVSNSSYRCPPPLSKRASIQTIIQIMNILSVFVLFAILLKCVAASGEECGS